EDGFVDVYVGTQSTGQGHETAYSQIVAEQLGVDFDRIRIRQGDSDAIPTGGGTGGARSLYSEGGAILKAKDAIIEKGKAVAAEMLETAQGDIEFAAGRFVVAGTDRGAGIMEAAEEARRRSGGTPGGAGRLDTAADSPAPGIAAPDGCRR